MTTVLRVGIDASELALARSKGIAAKLGAHEFIPVAAEGSAAVAPLRAALLAGEIDVLVHPLADLLGVTRDGIELVAVPKRADARDVWCSRGDSSLADLIAGARVGADTPRRRAQLLAAELEVVTIGGDLASRLARAADDATPDRLTGVMLAAADLDLIGSSALTTERLSLSDWPTDPAQGALGIEVAPTAAREARRRAVGLDHRASRLASCAEHAVLAELGVGFAAPVGATAILDDGLLFLTATVYAPDGMDSITASHAAYPEDSKGPADELGARVAAELLGRGAGDLAPAAAES